MSFIGLLLIAVGFIWSVARGIQVSLLCLILNIVFPPVSQAIFSIYEPVMRSPLVLMLVGGVMLFHEDLSRMLF